MISTFDYPVVMAFLERESHMYLWKCEANRLAFIERMFKEISERVSILGYNYLRIQSLSNMGLLTSELVLTPKEWDFHNGDVIAILPPSPKGGIGWGLKERGNV